MWRFSTCNWALSGALVCSSPFSPLMPHSDNEPLVPRKHLFPRICSPFPSWYILVRRTKLLIVPSWRSHFILKILLVFLVLIPSWNALIMTTIPSSYHHLPQLQCHWARHLLGASYILPGPWLTVTIAQLLPESHTSFCPAWLEGSNTRLQPSLLQSFPHIHPKFQHWRLFNKPWGMMLLSIIFVPCFDVLILNLCSEHGDPHCAFGIG